MRELYIEGVAIHGDPESCVGVREGVGHVGELGAAAAAFRGSPPTSCPESSTGVVDYLPLTE